MDFFYLCMILQSSRIGRYWFIELCRSSISWHISLYAIKSCSLISPQFHQKSLCKAVKLTVADTSFQNSNFHLTSWTSSLTTNTVDCFPSSDRLTLFIFKRLSVKYPTWLMIVVLSSKNGVPIKMQLIQLIRQLQKCFSSRPSLYLGVQQNCLIFYFITMLKRCIQKGINLIKLIIFAISSKTFLNETAT